MRDAGMRLRLYGEYLMKMCGPTAPFHGHSWCPAWEGAADQLDGQRADHAEARVHQPDELRNGLCGHPVGWTAARPDGDGARDRRISSEESPGQCLQTTTHGMSVLSLVTSHRPCRKDSLDGSSRSNGGLRGGWRWQHLMLTTPRTQSGRCHKVPAGAAAAVAATARCATLTSIMAAVSLQPRPPLVCGGSWMGRCAKRSVCAEMRVYHAVHNAAEFVCALRTFSALALQLSAHASLYPSILLLVRLRLSPSLL